MMKNSPLVSVIIPVYNVEKYLSHCLNSVLGQSLRDIEVICIDDGSSDDSLAILRDYEKQDERVRVIAQTNLGVSAARNAGLDVAKGEWVAFVDSDDEVMPDIWKTLLVEAGNEDAIYFSAEEVVMKDGARRVVESGYFDVKFKGLWKLRDEDLFRLSMTVWDKLFRRSKIEESRIRFPHGVYFEDNVFVLNFVGTYRLARFIPRKLYRYFRREGSITSQVLHHKPGIAFDYIKVLYFLYEGWSKKGLLPQLEDSFERMCFDMLRSAIETCQPWERTGIAYAMAEFLRQKGLEPRNKALRALKDGNLTIRLGDFPNKEITLLKPLRGWQKILYVGNWQGRKVLRIFGFKIASWEKQ